MSGALPCFDTPPVQNDLVVKDAADRNSRSLGESIAVSQVSPLKVQGSKYSR